MRKLGLFLLCLLQTFVGWAKSIDGTQGYTCDVSDDGKVVTITADWTKLEAILSATDALNQEVAGYINSCTTLNYTCNGFDPDKDLATLNSLKAPNVVYTFDGDCHSSVTINNPNLRSLKWGGNFHSYSKPVIGTDCKDFIMSYKVAGGTNKDGTVIPDEYDVDSKFLSEGSFAALINKVTFTGTPFTKLILDGDVNADDLAALRGCQAETMNLKGMNCDQTSFSLAGNTTVKYVTLPDDWADDDQVKINTNAYAGCTNICGAVSLSQNQSKLKGYVYQPGEVAHLLNLCYGLNEDGWSSQQIVDVALAGTVSQKDFTYFKGVQKLDLSEAVVDPTSDMVFTELKLL